MRRADVELNNGKTYSVAVADSYFLRLRGLIGRDPAEIGGLWIVPCNQIHTCFMSCAIDVIYLDRDNRVLRVEEAVPKGKLFPPVHGGKTVLELPSCSAVALGIVAGDTLKIEKSPKTRK